MSSGCGYPNLCLTQRWCSLINEYIVCSRFARRERYEVKLIGYLTGTAQNLKHICALNCWTEVDEKHIICSQLSYTSVTYF